MLLTRAPLYSGLQAIPFSFDLHVLSTPPAFILSQNQTLQLNSFDGKFKTCRLNIFRVLPSTQKIRFVSFLSLTSFQRSIVQVKTSLRSRCSPKTQTIYLHPPWMSTTILHFILFLFQNKSLGKGFPKDGRCLNLLNGNFFPHNR